MPLPASSLPYSTPDALWRVTLAELRPQMAKTTFDTWLAGSQVIVEASTLTTLVIAVANAAAQEWLTHRLHPVISRTVTGIAGHPVNICFTHNYTKGVVMNPLEDRLHAHTTTTVSDTATPAGPAPPLINSQRQLAYLEQKLMQAGIVPTRPIELPANTTPEVLNMLLASGDEPMNNQSNLTPTRVRIHSHITQSRFLHVEDALNIGKIRLFAGNYRRNQGMDAHAYHFIDLADARVIFSALACAEQGFGHKEYKGTPPQKDSAAVSRVLSVAVKGDNVYVELKTGPGKLTDTGAITPNGKPYVEVNVGFKLYEARRMAASVLAYIHAWDVLRMMVNQQTVSQPMPYLLVSTTSEDKDIQVTDVQANGALKPNGKPRPPVMTANNGRPVTRRDPVPKTKRVDVPVAARQANGKTIKPTSRKLAPLADNQAAKVETAVLSATLNTASEKQLLQYGNGLMVDNANSLEVQTFRQYVVEKQTEPASKAMLLTYYQQRVQTQAGVVSS